MYPRGASNGIEIKGGHMACLDDAEFLNDTVIDLYIRCAFSHAHPSPLTVSLRHQTGAEGWPLSFRC